MWAFEGMEAPSLTEKAVRDDAFAPNLESNRIGSFAQLEGQLVA